MNFTIEKSLEVLERTPDVLIAMLLNITDEWALPNEGGESWSPYDVVGHLIHGEKTDWIPRMEIILSDRSPKVFKPFDRFAQLGVSKEKSLTDLLHEFKALRTKNVHQLRARNISLEDLKEEGIHPAFGEVTLSQLLATWVVHDLNHISQISRVMAHQYKTDVGPWIAYLRILQ
jgi:hypothetical protein